MRPRRAKMAQVWPKLGPSWPKLAPLGPLEALLSLETAPLKGSKRAPKGASKAVGC